MAAQFVLIAVFNEPTSIPISSVEVATKVFNELYFRVVLKSYFGAFFYLAALRPMLRSIYPGRFCSLYTKL
jgi:hypothetical protein